MMNRSSRTIWLIALATVPAAAADAQIVVGREDFDSYWIGPVSPPPDDPVPLPGPGGGFVGYPIRSDAGITGPGVGGTGMLLRVAEDTDLRMGVFVLYGVAFDVSLAGNVSPYLEDYRLEFDMRLAQGEAFGNGLGFSFSLFDPSSAWGTESLYPVEAAEDLVVGGAFQHIILDLGALEFQSLTDHWDLLGSEVRLELLTSGAAESEVAQVFEIDNVQLIMSIPPLAADYNADGIVDAADYTTWRDHYGAAPGTLPNDVDGGTIGEAQFNTWKTNFGATLGAGSGAGATVTTVPEPTAAFICGGLALGLACWGVIMRLRLAGGGRNVGSST